MRHLPGLSLLLRRDFIDCLEFSITEKLWLGATQWGGRADNFSLLKVL